MKAIAASPLMTATGPYWAIASRAAGADGAHRNSPELLSEIPRRGLLPG